MEVTFQREQRAPKEEFEWIYSWCDHTSGADKPRVLLIGDSITFGYQPFVRELLSDACYVDHIATSYGADTAMYHGAVLGMAKDSDYALVHYNFGLHSHRMNAEEYRESVEANLAELMKRSKVILANTTRVFERGLNGESAEWSAKVAERNVEAAALAARLGLPLNDLYAAADALSAKDRLADGVHFEESGYRALAARVAESIRENIR